MTTPNRLNVTIGMSHLNKVGNDGSGNHANTTNLAESADQGQVHPLDQHHHSAQQLLDYSNPSLSLDDQPPFDEYSLSIQPLDECSISITTSMSDEYLNGGGCHGWQSQEVEFSKCPTASTQHQQYLHFHAYSIFVMLWMPTSNSTKSNSSIMTIMTNKSQKNHPHKNNEM